MKNVPVPKDKAEFDVPYFEKLQNPTNKQRVMMYTWNKCAYKDVGECPFEKSHDDCPGHCDWASLPFKEKALVDRALAELEWVMKNRDYPDKKAVQDRSIGIVLIEKLLVRYFGTSLRRHLTFKQRAFFYRRTLIK